jgi:hypothetical protein
MATGAGGGTSRANVAVRSPTEQPSVAAAEMVALDLLGAKVAEIVTAFAAVWHKLLVHPAVESGGRDGGDERLQGE